jgi:hypothetical protein
MKSEKELLSIVVKIFPGMETRAQRLYEEDDDFRSLCADYYYCLLGLNKFRQLCEAERKSAEEFEMVRNDLEKEIFDFLFLTK